MVSSDNSSLNSTLRKYLVVLLGPTGVGKTEVALQIARHLHTPVINADSRQIFREIPVGTAAPTAEQQQKARHYFVGNHSINDYYSASLYENDCLSLLHRLYSGEEDGTVHNVAFLTGGSMMYIDARQESQSVITIFPDEDFSITAMCSFNSKFISSQFATLDNISKYSEEIAPARTFVFVRDIVPLLEANLIKGGDLDNAIVIYERQLEQPKLDKLADLLNVPRIDATKIGYIQHRPLQWDNECTRHKLLDIIGDMALIGKPIKGRIIATRPGHTINNKFARLMRKEIRKHEVQAPIYDPNEEPLMDNTRIRQLLPHRYPMQLVDKITAMGATTIVGVKNVTANEPFFQGHFPQEPVMPGVLQIEAMAQCGGLLVLSQLKDPEKWSTYFLKIDDVKFRNKVVPGDTLLFKVELLAPVRHGISSMKGYVFVGDHVVSEATFTAQIIKNEE